MKRWVKVREETYPIKLLADCKKYSDDTTFSLSPFAHPAIDAEIKSANEKFHLQITIADPIWTDENGSTQNGGYDHRLAMEALNRFGVVYGSALMRRENDGKIVSGLPVKSFEQEFQACAQGLVEALQRKLKRGTAGTRLLVYARDYVIHTMDFSLGDVVNAALARLKDQIDSSAFDTIYFVDQNDEFFTYTKSGQSS